MSSPETAAAPVTPRTRWIAIAAAILPVVVGFWLTMLAIVPAWVLLALFVPLSFVQITLLSGNPLRVRGVLLAVVAYVVAGLPAAYLTGSLVIGLAVGLAAGAAVGLHRNPVHSWRGRGLAVLVTGIVVYLLLGVIPIAALLVTPIAPFALVGIGDGMMESKAAGVAG